MEIGTKIKRMRQSKGLTQKDLANILNISVQAYSKIERNETRIDNQRLELIAIALETTTVNILKNGNALAEDTETTLENIHKLEYMIRIQQEEIKALRKILEDLINKIANDKSDG